MTEDGRLISLSSIEHDGWQVHFEMINDLGKTWKHPGQDITGSMAMPTSYFGFICMNS